MSNFSRETFDELKRYVSVRLQQGVPLVDADWNELQDIRKHELEEFLRLFVGDGVPMGDDGFAIGSVSGGNDFSIAAGHCLVKGWCVVNESTVRYTEQTDAPPLKPPASGERIDKVYLDVWEREVDSEENPDLVNPDIGIETCVRIRREWRVRVAEGATSLPAPPAGHVFYPLATLNRKAGQDVIGTDSIIDLRRTGLNLASLKIYVDAEGNVGIGTKAPEAKLTVNDPIDTSSIPDLGFGRANVHALSAQSDYGGRSNEVLAMFRCTDGDGFSDVLLQHKYIGESPGRAISVWGGKLGNPDETREVHYVGGGGEGYFSGNVSIGTRNSPAKLSIQNDNPDNTPFQALLRIGANNTGESADGSFDKSAPSYGIEFRRKWYGQGDYLQAGIYAWGSAAASSGLAFRTTAATYQGPDTRTRMVITGNGNVGIGTSSPAAKLDIRGSSNQNAYHVDDGQEDLRILSSNNLPLDGGVITIGGSWGPTGYIKTTAQNLTAGDLVIGNRRSRDATRMEPGIVLRYDGNVGIGTTSPAKKLHIQGAGSGPLCNDGNDRPGLAITGHYPQLDLFSSADNHNHGPTIRLGCYTDDTLSPFKQWVIGTAGRNAHFLDFGFSDVNDPNPHWGIRGFGGRTVLSLGEDGNVGIGTLSPVYKLQVEGGIYARNSGVRGSDYAEYFESMNGKEIPVATSVVLEEGRVRPAKQGETPVGIISANPGVIGGIHPEWPKKYLRDEFDNLIVESHKEEVMAPKKEKVTRERQKVKRRTVEEQATRTEVALKGRKYLQKEITETVTREVDEPVFEEVDLYDASGKTVIGKHRVAVMETYEEEIDVLDDEGRPVLVGTGKFETKERPKLNPDYDEAKEYVPREKRPEWNCVGLLGKLPLRKGQPVAESWIKMKDITDEVELWLVK